MIAIPQTDLNRTRSFQHPTVILVLTTVLVSCGFAACVARIQRPLCESLQLGMDEHFEVIKAFLWSKGFFLYQSVWNDQPPLYTMALGLCFKAFGPTIGVARGLAVVFGLSLFVAFVTLVGQRAGALAAGIASFCLLASPQVFELSVSAMLEVPAIGTALWALWPILSMKSKPLCFRFALSGMIFATALQIKLTAAIVGPALIVEIFLSNSFSPSQRLRYGACAIGIWTMSLAATYLLLAWAFGAVPASVLWESHFAASTLSHAEITVRSSFLSILLLEHLDALCGAGIGAVVVLLSRAWRPAVFPGIWLITVAMIHWNHRPWWSYYYLHFAVPLAWLCGCGVGGLFRLGSLLWSRRRKGGRILAVGSLAIAAVVLATVLSMGESRVMRTLGSVEVTPRVDTDCLVSAMRHFAGRTRWVYTQSPIYAFHARLPIIPSLAVLPFKRFWSGQIDNRKIAGTVEEYKPEQLLLDMDVPPELEQVVRTRYKAIADDGFHRLYIQTTLLDD